MTNGVFVMNLLRRHFRRLLMGLPSGVRSRKGEYFDYLPANVRTEVDECRTKGERDSESFPRVVH